MRMSVGLDDNLVKQLMETFHTSTKREAIERAFREALRAVKRKQALEHRSSLELDISQEDLENLRSTPLLPLPL
jgi:Arc/MetJ family transcription regulator